MKFIKYYSSSRGNLYAVEAANGERLLIECGVTWKKLQKALNYNLSNIVGCLLTHEHKDHSKAVRDVLNAGIDVYASEGTLHAIDPALPKHRRVHIIYSLGRVHVPGFDVVSFSIHHDAADPVGFIIHELRTEEGLLFVTDTSHITQRFGRAFEIIAICCNYDKAVLKARVDSGDVNETFAKRLLTSHMEKDVTIRYITEFCNLDNCREIHLLHASRENVHIAQVKKALEERTFITTYS